MPKTAKSAEDTIDLVEVKRVLFDRAELAWYLSLIGQLVLFFAAILALAVPCALGKAILATLAFLASIASSAMRVLWSQRTEAADKARRILFYSQSFGVPATKEDLLELLNHLGAPPERSQRSESYFASTEEPGTRRLAENLTQSAFFTQFLARRLAKHVGWTLTILIALIISVLFFQVQLLPETPGVISTLAAGAAITLAFLASGDVFFLWVGYRDLSSGAASVYQRSLRLADRKEPEPFEMFQLSEDYHILTAMSPPVLSYYHQRYETAANTSYDITMKAGSDRRRETATQTRGPAEQ